MVPGDLARARVLRAIFGSTYTITAREGNTTVIGRVHGCPQDICAACPDEMIEMREA